MCRKLADIAHFSKERAYQSKWTRVLNKQTDADDIKKWEMDLTKSFDLFKVCIPVW
jgi:hypothetical protein